MRETLSLLLRHPATFTVAAAATLALSWTGASEPFVIAGVALAVVLAGTAALLAYRSSAELRARVAEIDAAQRKMWDPDRAALQRQLDAFGPHIVMPRLKSAHVEAQAREPEPPILYLAGIELTNIRCFESLALSFDSLDGPLLTNVILGDNASGKSTLLRSIAAGICPESDATGLLKALDGSFLRDSASEGQISLYLRASDSNWQGSIHTQIKRAGSQEIIRQETDPDDFPWDSKFVCAYGTVRTRAGSRSRGHEEYLTRLAVEPLFTDTPEFINPEFVFTRRSPDVVRRVERAIREVLLLDTAGVSRGDMGVEIEGVWGSKPLAVVSDGYRATSQWILDLLGWSILAGRFESDGDPAGILLIDEVEQHLHPRWQRHLLRVLREQFPRLQLIVTTHTPLTASGAADVSRSQIVRLAVDDAGRVTHEAIPPGWLVGKRADQVLTDVFGLLTSQSPRSASGVDRYAELLSRSRSPEEEREFLSLQRQVEESASAESVFDRTVDLAVSLALDKIISTAGPGHVTSSVEGVIREATRERLRDLTVEGDGE